jgi:pyruvate dehydrogenase E1 component beta subunit
VNLALDEELAHDPNVFLLGEDIGVYGGAFGVTKGLFEKYGPERVRETPISENGFVGAAVGAAMLGLRPVVEIMFMDFLALALDQILNSAGKLHYMYAGQVQVPLVIRTPGGAKGGYGPSHSQMLTNLLVGIPGIRVVAPSDPAQARALLKAAVRDPNPVVFIENKRLYGTRGEVPEQAGTLPDPGRARVVHQGDDVTIVAYSAMTPMDLVSLQPLDLETLVQSVQRTGRVVVAEEGCRTGGVGAEVAALIAEHALDVLEAPVLRVAAADTPIPSSMELEKAVLPSPTDLARAVRRVLEW